MSTEHSAESDAACNHSFTWRHPADNLIPPVAFAHLAACSRCGMVASAAPVRGSASITTSVTPPDRSC